MAVKVLELELTAPFPSLKNLGYENYDSLQILVRKDSQPVGYVWIDLSNKQALNEEFIKHELERQLLNNLNRIELAQKLGEKNLAQLTREGYDWPEVTVALCTRGRPESLDRALKSLTCLDYPQDKLEVLIIDNAPPDDATEKVAARYPQFSYVQEPRPGLDWARNRAIKEALGDIIAYTDDDVSVDPLWLKGLVRHFSNPYVMCVTGLVAPAERETYAQNLFEQFSGFGKGFERRIFTPGLNETQWNHYPLGAGEFGTGASMAYRKAIFDKVGGFDEALDVGTVTHGGGDLEMYYRIIRHNYILVYEPEALVWHYHRRDYHVLSGQIRDWGRGAYAFWTRVFTHEADMRWKVLRYSIVWYLKLYLKQIVRRSPEIRKLRIREATGALQGPFAYFVARRQANQIKNATWPVTTVRRGGGLAEKKLASVAQQSKMAFLTKEVN